MAPRVRHFALILLTSFLGCASGSSDKLSRGSIDLLYGTQFGSGTSSPQQSARQDVINYYDKAGIDLSWTIMSPSPPAPQTLSVFGDSCRSFYYLLDGVQAANDCKGTQDMMADYATQYRSIIHENSRRILVYVSPLYVAPNSTPWAIGVTYSKLDTTKEISYVFDDVLTRYFGTGYNKDRWMGVVMAHELGHQIAEYPHLREVDYTKDPFSSGAMYDNNQHSFADTVNGKCLMSVNITQTDINANNLHFCLSHGSLFCCTNRLRDHFQGLGMK